MSDRQPLQGLPAVVMTDIDGVWTDGGMYYDCHGNELKKFNTSDSAGILFLRELSIPVCILTGEDTEMVGARARKLRIDYLRQGVTDKVKVASEICETLGTTLANAAYIGDDLNDIKLLSHVGLSCCPANSPSYIKSSVDVVTTKKGGDGAFREFIETILTRCGRLDDVLDSVVGTPLASLTKWQ